MWKKSGNALLWSVNSFSASPPVRKANQGELQTVYYPNWTALNRRNDCEAEELLSAVGNPFKLTSILHFSDFLDERVHVIASCVVKQQRDEEAAALPLQVASVACSTKGTPL